MNILIMGSSSRLSQEIVRTLDSHKVFTFGRNKISNDKSIDVKDISTSNIESIFGDDEYDFYIFNLGMLIPKNILEQSGSEIIDSLKVNAIFTIKSCEYILKKNLKARIIIIGSESGKKGSFDTSYFLSKAMLRSYVKERYLYNSSQQLLLISPSTISDSKMTIDRKDQARLSEYMGLHPKSRFLHNQEIAEVVQFLIESKSTYICNTEIEINGGKFARLRY